LALKRQIGVSYNTAWSLKQKVMQAMKERDDRKPLSGIIEYKISLGAIRAENKVVAIMRRLLTQRIFVFHDKPLE